MTCCVQAHLQGLIEFGKDSHPKFAPTPRFLLFLNFPLETVAIIFYIYDTAFSPKAEQIISFASAVFFSS